MVFRSEADFLTRIHKIPFLLAVAVFSTGVVLPVTRGETIWQWTHEASGSGSANVFNGGPMVFKSDSTDGPQDGFMSFVASDDTRPGIFGARFGTGGDSVLSTGGGDAFALALAFDSGYSARSRPAADRPGGEGEGTLSSVIEFVMPQDELSWRTILSVTLSPGYHGSTRIVVENITKSTVLRELTGNVFDDSVLSGAAGDLIRVSSEISGGGSTPPGVPGSFGYDVSLLLAFRVPEPGTAVLVLIGAGMLTVRRRRAGCVRI